MKKKLIKKLLSILIVFSLCLSISIPALAADLSSKFENEKTVLCDITLLDENGEYTTYTVNPDEANSIPVFQSKESSSGISTYAIVQTATLSIGRSSGGNVYWKFTPTLSTFLLTLGFTGYFSVMSYSGLSHGFYLYSYEWSSYVPGPARCRVTLSGTYHVIGYSAASILQNVYIP